MRNILFTFPEGKHKVLTFSYDDGKVPDRRLVDIFNRNGLKGTFNVNSGLEDKEFTKPYEERIHLSEYKELYKGHEVACHTVTHPTVARIPKEQMVCELIEDRQRLEEVMGYPVRGLAYPNGSYSDDVVEAAKVCGIVYARTVTSTESFAMPNDYLRWNPTCKHNDPRLHELGKEFRELHKTQNFYMMYVWGHSYEFDVEDNWDVIEKFAEDMSGCDDIWYATNIEIVDYLEASKRVQVSVNGDFAYNPNAISVFLEIDKKCFELKPGTVTQL